VAIAGLILAARFVPGGVPGPAIKIPPHPLFFLLLGFANMTLFFVAVYVLPETLTPPLALSVIGLLLLDAFTLWILLRWSGSGGAWDDRHRLAWVAGGLGFFILFNFTSDLEAFAGKSCVSAIAVIGLIVFGLVVGRRRREILPSP
jgi:hypothetical protein